MSVSETKQRSEVYLSRTINNNSFFKEPFGYYHLFKAIKAMRKQNALKSEICLGQSIKDKLVIIIFFVYISELFI